MRANELMIGDFVFHEKYGNAIIETIDNDFGDNPSVKLISENIKHKNGYKYGYCWCDLDEIFPIPLTQEILEKNGMKSFDIDRLTDKATAKWWHKGGDFFIKQYHFKHHNFKPTYSFGCSNHTLIEGIQYVHELQHALKLCGIGIEINL